MSRNGQKIAVMFPGQGSQFLGMGEGFLAADPEARALLAMAEEVSGLPLGRLMKDGPMEELTRTLHLQPALTVMNLICWQALGKAGIVPDFVVGHSLGEYSALCAAGILTPADTLALVTERGRLMEREGGEHPGGMRAVLGFSLAEVQAVLAQLAPSLGVVVTANHNTPQQVVISGELVALEEASRQLTEQGAKVIALNVAIANHSPLVQGATADFRAAMVKVDFRSPTTPMLFNTTAAEERQPDAIRAIMAGQLSSMVRWVDTLNELAARGVTTFIEVGPKTVLSGLLKKTLSRDAGATCVQFDEPAKLAACLATLGAS